MTGGARFGLKLDLRPFPNLNRSGLRDSPSEGGSAALSAHSRLHWILAPGKRDISDDPLSSFHFIPGCRGLAKRDRGDRLATGLPRPCKPATGKNQIPFWKGLALKTLPPET
jgi:hypothetical protein